MAFFASLLMLLLFLGLPLLGWVLGFALCWLALYCFQGTMPAFRYYELLLLPLGQCAYIVLHRLKPRQKLNALFQPFVQALFAIPAAILAYAVPFPLGLCLASLVVIAGIWLYWQQIPLKRLF